MSERSRAERRHAPRLTVNLPVLVEVIGQRELSLHPNLQAVYERVNPSTDNIGQKFPAVVRDLSTNGAFIAGPALPLLSRVAFTFKLDDFGQVEVLAWTMWRRRAECEVPIDGKTVKLSSGFGVLFEAISLDARRAIADLVQRAGGPAS